MVVEIVDPNTCIRGCCSSKTIPLHLPPSSYSLISPIARGAESVVYEAVLDGRKVAAKKPILATSDDLDRFHKELQLLCKLDHQGIATLVAAHAKPPNYIFFFQFYESRNLAEKLHVEEWSPGIDQVLFITVQLGYTQFSALRLKILFSSFIFLMFSSNSLMLNRRAKFDACFKFSSDEQEGLTPIYCSELLTGIVPYTDLRAEAQVALVFQNSKVRYSVDGVQFTAHTVLEMNYTEQQLTASVVSEGLRPVVAGPESGAPASFLSLIQRCWDANPQNRPSFDNIVAELDLILEHRHKIKEEDKVQGVSSTSVSDQLLNDINILQTYKESINWFIQGEKLSQRDSFVANSSVRIWPDSSIDSIAYHPILSWGSFATCGRRETMEDTHFLMPQMCNEKDIHVFGIFDGHRGGAAAEFSARALPGFLQTLGSTSSPSDALLEAFVKTDDTFRSELASRRNDKGLIQKDWHPGCTAVASLIIKNKLFVANAGDCRTILCRGGCPFALSKDHVASCLEERERVIREGGEVKWQVDTWRVGPAALQVFICILEDLYPGFTLLNDYRVTRSIGDDDLKPAVTAEPEITETILSSEDEYLVMASDGLWDVVSNEEVISIIRDTVKEPGMCSKRLATEAAERGSKDNITVIVVFLRPVSTAERIY
ncbi:hypothetical protein HHK36_011682 [Tetracentron sinense]|uniref:Protein-serine/threonine phosphatase n=1 Tax=Tetracentron sinense TaxID=13715 RepID=A0A835DGG9_TETSI|nr:hypothetical protein HHK36_011682 [Tetracentron sinense]